MLGLLLVGGELREFDEVLYEVLTTYHGIECGLGHFDLDLKLMTYAEQIRAE